MKKQKSLVFDRREALLGAIAAGGGLALRSLLLGLPTQFLTQRSMALTQANFLVYSMNSGGCPINCNVPGTYVTGFDHAPEFATPVMTQWGSQNHLAASCWSNLKNEIKKTSNIFNLRSLTNSHNQMGDVTNIFGSIESPENSSAEMLPSIIAHELAKQHKTQLNYPVAMSGPLTVGGKNQKIYSPSSIKALFPSGVDAALANARTFRDQQLDLLYKDIKTNGTPAQMRFMSNYVSSADEAKKLAGGLADALSSVTGNEEIDYMKTAAALLALKLTPVVTVGISFGGDNHADTDLVGEVARHKTGIASINSLYDSLKTFGIENKTTFALLNVFGRTTKVNGRGGRDHNGSHTIMYSFGAGVKGGVIGETQVGKFKSNFEVLDLNSATGKAMGADITATQTLHSAAKSLMVATGIPESQVNKLVTGGKVVKPFLA